jgi:N-acetylglucosamine kinase-like BadF-type ATPase
VKRLSSVYICSVCPPEILLGTLYEFVAVEHIQPIDEGRMGMYAGCVSGSAVMTLSGTGSDIYYVKDNRTLGAIGGWGQMIADEGSGFWIGKQGLLAAIYFFEGRGKPTMLNQLIANQFIPYDFRGSVFQLYTLDSPSRGIAALSRVVDQAARQ